MVGAGFSRNAEPSAPAAREFPLWDQLARQMAKGIGLDDDKPRDPLRLAQMYASTRGRMELDRLIERSVPDREWRPGELHQRLLGLPWADVFTTNYDTLFERARDDVLERRYEVICAPSDIPMRRQPRLVKLHGTLGMGQRLIATEEDYRCYPREFPAFVNLVQGAVMETVFVLIGFAGDDPNFLEWTGWVRDILGNQAPRIYLCGLLDQSAAACALLAERRVTPVDLSRMFPESLGEARHKMALSWLLAALESGKTARPEEWAPIEPIKSPTPCYPTPVPVPLPPAPVRTPFNLSPKASSGKGPETSVEDLREIAKAWAAQRAEYPGWHVAPNQIRFRIWRTTQRWRRLVFFQSDALPLEERLLLLHELCWRLELCLSPVFTDECDRLVEWLEQVDPFEGRLELPKAKIVSQKSARDLAEAWKALALHVVRTAREDLDIQRFELWHRRLSLVGESDASLRGELSYEQVMWHLNALDLSAFRRGLDTWRSLARQPLELLRLASCHAELGEHEVAAELASAAIKGARARGRKPEAISLEAWGCHLLSGLHGFGSKSDSAKEEEARERVAKAKTDGYDLWEIVKSIEHDLSEHRPKRRPARQRVAGFDAGAIRETRNLGGSDDDLMPAFRLMRLLERAPCPIYSGILNFFATGSSHAAVWLENAAPSWALSTLLRVNPQKELLQERFNRAAVATLKPKRVQVLCEVLLRVIDVEMARIKAGTPGRSNGMERRMAKAAMELLSRIAMRASPAMHKTLLSTCETWLSSPEVAADYDYYDALRSLVERVVETLPEEMLAEAVVVLLATPMPAEGSFKPWEANHWPDAFLAMWDREVARPEDRGKSWKESWRRIVQGIRNEDETLRSAAFERGHFLFSKGWLNADEVNELDAAVWSQVSEVTGLPKMRTRRLSWFLHMAKASEHGVPEALRRLLLSSPLLPLVSEKGSINSGDVAAALSRLEDLCVVFRHPKLVEPDMEVMPLSETESVTLQKKLVSWWPSLVELLGKRKGHFDLFSDSFSKLAPAASEFLGDVLMLHLPPGHRGLPQIESMLSDLERAGESGLPALVGRLFHRPELLPTVRADLERILIGGDEIKLRLALSALGRWRKAAKAGVVPLIPPILIDRVVSKFGFRHDPRLDATMKFLADIAKNDFELFTENQRGLLLLGLEQLAAETETESLRAAYERSEKDGVEVAEALHLRAWAAVLASALSKAFAKRELEVPPVLLVWREICTTDPLPEVREAWRI